MPTLVAGGAFDIQDLISNGSLSEFFDSGEVSTASDTTFVVSYSDPTISEQLTLTGTFGDYVDGYPTTGTITSASYWLDGNTLFTITDMSMSVEDFTSFVNSDDLTGLFQTILAGADTLLGSDGNDVLLGFDGDDTLRGGTGDDQLHGGAGDDFLSEYSGDSGPFGNDLYDGGEGADRVSYFTSDGLHGVSVDLNLTGSQNTGQGNDTLISIEHVTATYDNDLLIGNDADNWFWSFSGIDTLYGQGGNDYFTVGADDKLISGGTGIDTVDMADFSYAQVYQNAGGINVSLELQDTAQWVGTGYWTLSSIENLGGFTGNDTLTGDGNANILAGQLGNDSLYGGGGNDMLYGDGVWIMVGGVQTLLEDDLEDGQGGDDDLHGGAGNDQLFGGRGHDILDGGTGNDRMMGGADDDSYFVDSYRDAVIEYAGEGNDSVFSTANYVLSDNVEALTLTGSADLYGYGNAGDNILTGNSGINKLFGLGGNDVLDGGAGSDRLFGGTGNDIYYVDAYADRAIENAGEGNDEVRSSASYRLGDNIETLTLTGSSGIWGYGNAGDNTLTGNSGNNKLFGLGGNDVLDGGAGTDRMWGGTGDDVYYVDRYADRVFENSRRGHRQRVRQLQLRACRQHREADPDRQLQPLGLWQWVG